LACVAQAGQDRSGYCRRLRALAKPKILSNAAFPNYFTGSKNWASKPPLASRQRIIKKARPMWCAFKCIGGGPERVLHAPVTWCRQSSEEYLIMEFLSLQPMFQSVFLQP
jgi:hypothetical protein